MVLLGVPQASDPGAAVAEQLTPAAGRRHAVDRRLFRMGRGARPFLAAVVVLGLAGAGLAIARAVLLAHLVAQAFAGTPARALADPLAGLLGLAAGSAAVAWLTEVAAHHSAAGVKSSLRHALLQRAAEREGEGERAGALAAAAGRGIEALDVYFARYLPQLALAVAVPVFVLAW
ncbi:MAG: transporter, partial [Actinobacteria bacterium]|nr:transporter [Actinomycetota bacterium]